MGSPGHEALQPLRHFLYTHMHEETGHETWVLNDLDAVGVTPAQAQAHSPSVHTLALNGYNYWAADRRHPCSVLGMLYVLEVIASVYGGPFAAALRESLLLDGERGVSFIASHATMDTQHMADLRQVLNWVVDDEAKAAVVESTRVNFHHFTRIIEAI
jgi:heme oxygenase